MANDLSKVKLVKLNVNWIQLRNDNQQNPWVITNIVRPTSHEEEPNANSKPKQQILLISSQVQVFLGPSKNIKKEQLKELSFMNGK